MNHECTKILQSANKKKRDSSIITSYATVMVPRPQILGPREKGEDSTKYQQEVIPPPSK